MTPDELEQLPKEKLIELYEIISHKPTMREWEAAIYLALSIPAIRELRYKKQITYVQKGRRISFRRVDLDKFLMDGLIEAV